MTARALLTRWNQRRRFVALGLISALILGLMVVTLAPPTDSAKALSGNQFNPGYIIDDARFYDPNAMTAAQIQAFLNAQEPGTCGNALCLKNLHVNTLSRPRLVAKATGLVRCEAYAGANNESAATVIFKVQQSCSISAKVILVTLQKEQALINRTAPSQSALDRAMGFACPDTAPCASTTLGFSNQVYSGALQLNTYRASRFGKQPGTYPIQLNPNAGCGTKTVTVTNYATAALYNYTPYTPNDAALNNLSGTGNSCSSYGNRNFWVYYTNWFGGPTGNPQGALQATAAGSQSVTVSGWAVDPDAPLNALQIRIRGNGWSTTVSAGLANAASQTLFAGAGANHGFSSTVLASVGTQQVCADAVNQGTGVDVQLGCSTVTVTTPTVVTRTSGTDRYDTAVQISRASFPGTAASVFIASGENFPDAISAAPAAASASAPLLLTPHDQLPVGVSAEIKRLSPHVMYVIGGESAISSAVLTQLQAIAPVQRVSGVDRWATSLAVSDIVGAKHSGTAYIASGLNFPDAVSGAPAAGSTSSPLVLVGGSGTVVPSALALSLARWGVTNVKVLGGSAVISDSFVQALDALPNITVTRLSGADRYGTSLAVNQVAFPNATTGYIASGALFPDALTGGAVAGMQKVPVYLALPFCVPAATLTYSISARVNKLTLFGGSSALFPAVAALAPC